MKKPEYVPTTPMTPAKVKFKTFEEVEKFFEDHFDWFATAGYKSEVIGTTIYYWKKKDAPTMWVSDSVKGE